MTDSAKVIRRELRRLESAAAPMSELRECCKTEGGHLTTDGRRLIKWARNSGQISQATIARVLDVSPTAVSRHWNA